jgi:hypothetical protein
MYSKCTYLNADGVETPLTGEQITKAHAIADHFYKIRNDSFSRCRWSRGYAGLIDEIESTRQSLMVGYHHSSKETNASLRLRIAINEEAKAKYKQVYGTY